MAATIPVEVESGTYSGRVHHPHNGYYAGDFSSSRTRGSGARTGETAGVPAAACRS
jgi:hypothetical protein